MFLNYAFLLTDDHMFSVQKIMLPPSGSFDPIRTLRMTGYGLLILGPSQHLWFNFVAKVLPKRDVITTLKKIIMGQAIFGPCINSVFFSVNAALQGTQEICISNHSTKKHTSLFFFLIGKQEFALKTPRNGENSTH